MTRRTRSLRRGLCSRMLRDPRGRYGSVVRALRHPRPPRAACRPRARRSPSSAVARAAGSPPPLLPPRQPPRSPAGRARTAPWARTGAPDEADNQMQSDAIRRHQTPSDAFRRHQTQSDAIRRHQTPSDVIRRHQTRTGAPLGHRRAPSQAASRRLTAVGTGR